MSEEQVQPQLALERIYTKDISFEVPGAQVFTKHGSLLVMKDTTQTYWLHRLPPTKKIFTPRINLTFRTIVE